MDTSLFESLQCDAELSDLSGGVRRLPVSRRLAAARMAGILLFALLSCVLVAPAEAQAPKRIYRIGVVHQGGVYNALVDGLRDGLRELGMQEGRDFVLDVREAGGDLKTVEDVAQRFEREKVDVLYTGATSVTRAAKRATREIPIVFYVGTDPVNAGLVDSYAKPGGRLTGIHTRVTDLTTKRLEILLEIVPGVQRIVTFYDPANRSAADGAKALREAASQMRIKLLERPVSSVAEVRSSLREVGGEPGDAIFLLGDAMVLSQAQLIIDVARAKKMPTMSHEHSLVADGALASYGTSLHEIGRMSAKHLRRVLAGTPPRDLPIESFDRIELHLNLRTAREIGITVPQGALRMADKLIK